MTSKRSTAKKKPSARQQRAARARRRQRTQRLVWVGTWVLAALVLLGGIWGWKTEIGPRALAALGDSLLEITADAGFAVGRVVIEGRQRTPLADIADAVALPEGSPILGVSVEALRERLERLDWVKSATVERRLPDALAIRIEERQPVAFWQQRGSLRVIDEDGVTLPTAGLSVLPRLPVLVGEDAPAHAKQLLTMLNGQPALKARVTAAIRVGGRRWNVRFDNGVEVKLPEDEPEIAWRSLAELALRDNLLDKGVTGVDLRLPDRMYLKLPKDTMKHLRGDKKT